MELILIGIATAFNFIVIWWKFEKGRYTDVALDLGTFVAIAFMFSGTVSGLTVGMIASAIVSLYLLIIPPKLPSW